MQEILENHISNDKFEAFELTLSQKLIHADTFINVLRFALSKRAEKFIRFLCEFQNSLVEDPDKKTGEKYAQQLFKLIGYEYAEYFQSNYDTRKLRTNSLKKVNFFKQKKALLAALSGDLEVFQSMKKIPMDPGYDYHPYMLYAAANNQVDLVRYLYPKLDSHKRSYWHKIAMAAALIQNANQVFDFLIQTDFERYTQLPIGANWPCSVIQSLRSCQNNLSFLHLAVALKRPNQYWQLLEKGEQCNDSIFQFAIEVGDINMIECCEQSGIQFPANSLEIAIKHGHPHLIRYLLNKGLDFSSLSVESTPLCLAVECNRTSVVEELLSLNVDVLACNIRGEHPLFLASINSYPPEILQKLLEHLKVKLTAKELAEFLNKPIADSNQPILYHLADALRKNDEKNNKYALINLTTKATLLIHCGASIFSLRTCPEKQTQLVDLIYLDEINSNSLNLAYLNLLACWYLKFAPITQDIFKIVCYLEAFLEKEKTNLGRNLDFFSPAISTVVFIKRYLLNAQKFKEMINNANINVDFQDILDSAALLFLNPRDRKIIADIVDETIVSSKPGQHMHLFLFIDIFACLCKFFPTKAFLFIADILFSKVSLSETDKTTQWHDNQRLVLANYLYKTVGHSEDVLTQDMIKKCNEAVSKLSFDLRCIAPRVDPSQYVLMLTNKIIGFAITNNLIGALQGLVKLGQPPSILVLWQLKNAKNPDELAQYFNKFIALCGDSPDIFRNSLNYESPALSAKMGLALLLTKEPQDKIRRYLGIYLNHLKNNNPRKLLILAHILTHYKNTVAKPDTLKEVFDKALAELATNLCQEYPEKIMIAILQIRLELVKLFDAEYASLETEIDTVRQKIGKSSIRNCIMINNNITIALQKLLPPGNEHLRDILDDLFTKMIVSKPSTPRLNFQNIANETDPQTGKRRPTEDITHATSPKRAI